MDKSKFFKCFLLLFFPLLCFVIYLPAFVTEFGFHNDYSMLIYNKNSWLGFIESGHLLLIGRALGAVFISLHCHFLHRISDFAISRLVAFGAMVIFTLCLFRYFRKKSQGNVFWSCLMAWGLFLLPSNQTFILWTCNFGPGPLNLLLAFAAYSLLESAGGDDIFLSQRRHKLTSVFYLLGSFLLFLASLFIYSPTSIFVFVLTFLLILFSPLSQWPRTRLIVLRDFLFFGAAMLVYWLLDRSVIFPLALKTGQFGIPVQPEYKMAVTSDWSAKIPLLKETWLCSLSGPWHLFWGNQGAFMTVSILIILGGMIVYRAKTVSPKFFEQFSRSKKILYPGQIALAIFLIFVGVNLPMLFAQGNLNVRGYRVLFPSASMILIAQFWLMYKNDQFASKEHPFSFMKIGAFVLILFYAFLTLENVSDTARNYSRELNFIREKVEAADLAETRVFVVKVIPRGETVIKRKMPFEFGYMITDPQHVAPIIWESLKDKGLNPRPCLLVPPEVVIDPRITRAGFYIIDLNELRPDIRNPESHP